MYNNWCKEEHLMITRIRITPTACAKLAQNICERSTSLRMYYITTAKLIMGYRTAFESKQHDQPFRAPRYRGLSLTVYPLESCYIMACEGEEVKMNELYDLDDLFKMHYAL